MSLDIQLNDMRSSSEEEHITESPERQSLIRNSQEEKDQLAPLDLGWQNTSKQRRKSLPTINKIQVKSREFSQSQKNLNRSGRTFLEVIADGDAKDNTSSKRQDDIFKLSALQMPSIQRLFPEHGVSDDPNEGMEERLTLASECVHGAIYGFEPSFKRSNPMAKKFEMIQRSRIYRWTILFIIVAHILLIFWEIPATRGSVIERNHGKYPIRLLLLIELLFTCIYMIDLGMQLYSNGIPRFKEKKWNMVFSVTCIITLLDIIWNLIMPTVVRFRIARPFRSVFLICKLARIRRITSRIFRSIYRTFTVLLCGLIVSSWYALIGTSIFTNDYNDDTNPYKTQNFDSFGDGLLAMIILITTENFPDIFFLGYDNHPYFSAVFFISFVIAGTWIFLNLVMAVIYNFFKEEHLLKLSKERVLEQQNLLIAFRILKGDDEEVIDFDLFQRLIKKVRPHASEGMVRTMFLLLDEDASGFVSIREFLFLVDTLTQFTITKIDSNLQTPRFEASENLYQRLQRLVYFHSDDIKQFIERKFIKILVYVLVLINVVSLVVIEGTIIPSYFVKEPGVPLGEGADARSLVLLSNIISFLFLAIMLLECGLGVLAYGWSKYWRKYYFLLFIIVVSLPVEILCPFYLRVIARSFRILRLISLSGELNRVLLTISHTMGILIEVLTLMLMVFYLFAIVGMEMFSSISLGLAEPYAELENFDSFPNAMLSLFQISTTNNWQDVMYPAVDKTTALHSLFFILFFFAVCMVILNILATLIISAYTIIEQSPELGDSQIYRVMLENGNVERWQVRYRDNYFKSLVRDELPVFNPQELENLKNKLERLEQKLALHLAFSRKRAKSMISQPLNMAKEPLILQK